MSKTDPIGLALIGAGRIGKLHAEHLTRRIDGAKLVGIADVNLDAAKACGASLGVELITQDPGELMQRSDVDAVVICSATNTHAELIESAAKAKKHIFCEKPIALDLNTIDRALAAVAESGVHLQIGFNRRFDPGFAHVRQQIEQGAVGELHLLRITSRDPAPPPIEYVRVSGGLFLDMTIHDLDMARFLAGSEVASVYAAGGVRVGPEIGRAGDIDTAVLTLTFENGVFATIDNSRKATYGYDQRVEAFGSAGMVFADNRTHHNTGAANASGFSSPRLLDFFMDRYTESYLLEMAAFLDAIRADAAPPVGGRDGRAPVVLALAARRSLTEKRAVSPSEIEPT